MVFGGQRGKRGSKWGIKGVFEGFLGFRGQNGVPGVFLSDFGVWEVKMVKKWSGTPKRGSKWYLRGSKDVPITKGFGLPLP